MKTEQEQAEMLIEQYYKLFSNSVSHITMDRAIRCAINDVTNTIEAMSQMKLIFSDRELILKYYNNVLNILKEKV